MHHLTVDNTVIQTEVLLYLIYGERVIGDLHEMQVFSGRENTCLVLFLISLNSGEGSFFFFFFLGARIIEILHLISKVSLPRFRLPARIYNRLTLKVI